MIDKDKLVKKIEEYNKKRDNLVAEANAMAGAILACEELLKDIISQETNAAKTKSDTTATDEAYEK